MTNDLPVHWSCLTRVLLWFASGFGIGSACAVEFRVGDGLAGVGEVFETEVRVSDFSAVQAFQFSLSWDASILRFSEVSDFSLPGLGPNSFGVFESQGQLSVIWDSRSFDGETLEAGALLFRLSFEVLGQDGASSMMEFGDTPTRRLVVQDLAQGEFDAVPGTFVVGRPPGIEGITELSLFEDQASEPIPFVFSDDVTLPFDLKISVTSSNEALISGETIQLRGDGAERELLFQLTADRSGQCDIILRAVDESGGETVHTLRVTVTGVNDAPQAIDDEFVLDEDSDPVEILVLANDLTFPDLGESLSVGTVTAGSNGGLTEVLADRVIYQPAPQFNGTESFTYVVRDEGGLSDTGQVTITVRPVNDPPTVVADFLQVPEDSGEIRVMVLANDTGLPDLGEELRVTEVSDPNQGGAVSLREGQVFYRPAKDFYGVEAFTYIVADGNGGATTGQVEIEVQGINDPPQAIADGVSVPEDSREVFVPVLENDHTGPDRDEKMSVVSVTATSSGGQVRFEAMGVFYSPAPNFFGTETFEYTMSDGNGGIASARVTVTVVNDRADAPVARDDHFTVPEDSEGNTLLVLEDNGSGRDFDPDGDGLRVVEVSSVDGPAELVDVAFGGQAILYTPATDFVGAETLSYILSDGENQSVGFVFVTVSNANNDPPRARPDQFTVDEDTVENRFNVLEDNGFGPDVDPEGASLVVILVPGAGPLNGTVGVSDDGLALIYTPLPNFSGVDQMHYFVSDGTGQARGTVDVTVVNVDNDPPFARDDRIVLAEDVADQRVDVLGNNGNGPDFDPEDDELLIVSVEAIEGQAPSLDGALAIGVDQQNLFFTPPPNFVGEATFVYTIQDGVHEATARVTLQVENGDDDPPVALDDRFEVDEGATEVSLRVLGSPELGMDRDPEGEPLVVVGVSPMGSRGGRVAVGPLQRSVTYTPLPDFVGEETFQYQVSDGKFTSTGSVVVLVRNLDDDPPVLNPDQFVVPEDSVDLRLLVLEDNGAGVDFDPEGLPLEIVDVEPIGEVVGRVQLADDRRSLLYTPRENFIGEESFFYRATDGHEVSQAILSIRVENSDNDPPVARDDQFFALEDAALIELRVLEDQGAGPDFDPDGDPLTIVKIPDGSPGSRRLTLAENRRAILYESAANFFGADRFSYSISDGTHVVDATVTVLVTRGGNDPPLARKDHFTVPEDSIENEFNVLLDHGFGADTDPDGDPLLVVAVHGPASQGGSVALRAGGSTVVYSPASEFNGQETFEYTVSDGQLTSTAEVLVTVSPIPDAPQILPVSDIEVDQGPVSIEVFVSVFDSDSPDDSLTFSVRSENEAILASEEIEWIRLAEGWRILMTPGAQASGEVTLVMSVSDGVLSTESRFRLNLRRQVALTGNSPGGMLRGGRVFVDRDNNGERGEGEPHGEILADGSFSFLVGFDDIDRNDDGILSYRDGHLVVEGAIDRRSGTPTKIQFRAPLGVSLVSSFSTLVSALLDAGLDLDLDAATDRARQLMGLTGEGLEGQALLFLDPFGFAGTNQPPSRELLHRMTSLHALTSQLSVLISPILGEESWSVSTEVMRVMAASEATFMTDCPQVVQLLMELIAGLNVSISSEKRFLVERMLCAHLEWISKIEQSSDSAQELAQGLSRLHLFSEFELERDLRVLGAAVSVSGTLSFRYSPPQFDSRVADFLATETIENGEMPGVLRFLRRAARVGEDGGDFEMPALVREGGARGELTAAVLLAGLTATPVSDYSVQPVLVTFEDGELVQSLDLSEVIHRDDLIEGDEIAEVRLFYGDEVDENDNPLIKDSLRLSIEDADSPNAFEFSGPQFEVDEDAGEAAVFVLRRGSLHDAASVFVEMKEATGTGAAESGVDFMVTPVRVDFDAGERIRGIELPVIKDFEIEESEFVRLRLMLAVDGLGTPTLGSIAESLLTIRNDDFDQLPMIEVISDQVIDEDGEITVAFSVEDDATALGDLRIEAVSRNLNLFTVDPVERNPLNDRFSIRLRSVANAFGVGEAEVRVSDPFQTVRQIFSVEVTPVNDPPIITIPSADQLVFVEESAPLPIARGIQIEDIDDENLLGATIGFSSGFRFGEDRLIFADGGGEIRGEYQPESGLLSLSGVASVDDYRRAISSVLYENQSDDPNLEPRLLMVSVVDGLLGSAAQEFSLAVESVNDPPLLTRIERVPLVYLENASPVPLTDTILVEPVEDETYFEVTVRIVGHYEAAEDRLLIEEIPLGLSMEAFDPALGMLRIMGEGTWEDYQSALRSVRYHNLSEKPVVGERLIEFQLRDSELFSTPAARGIQVVSVNDPPVFADLGNITALSGESLTVEFGVNDVDSEIGLPVVTVGSSNPSLVIASSVRVTRNEQRFVLSFDIREGEDGEAEFRLSVRDGNEQTVHTFMVVVRPRHLAPSITGPERAVTHEDELLSLRFQIEDMDSALDSLSLTARVDNPSLFQPERIRQVLDGAVLEIQLMPEENVFGRTLLTVELSDGEQTVSHQVEIEVRSINDMPVVSGVEPREIEAGVPLEFGVMVGDIETAPDQLLVGVRPVDPGLAGRFSFEVRGQGEERTILLRFEPDFRGVAALELVVLDSDAGVQVVPFEVTVHEGAISKPHLSIIRLSDGTLELWWEGDGRLSIADRVDGVYRIKPLAVSPYTVPLVLDRSFFRIVD